MNPSQLPSGCKCPVAGWCAHRNQFMSTRLHTLCKSGQPIPSFSSSSVAQDSSYGPGTELLRIYEAAGIPSCQACRDLAQQMNNWGVEGCELRLLEIVEEIFPRAQGWIAENHPWLHAILPNCMEEGAIRLKVHSDVAQAIQVAKDVIRERREKNLDVYTGAVKPKSCCH